MPVAEAFALREGLLKARDLGCLNVLVEGDSKLVVNCVLGSVNPPWRLLHIIHDIRMIADSFESFSISHIFREANFVADSLAQLGQSSPSCLEWSDGFPRPILDRINFDLFGSGCPRGFSL